MRRVTVHDIAAEAGVSLATVDRVMNRRAGVRHQTMQKVEAAMDRLNYVRDVAAANLARGRSYRLVFVLPGGPNTFMELLHREVQFAAKRGTNSRIHIDVHKVPPFDSRALLACLKTIDPTVITGLVLVATDAPEVRDQLIRLRSAGVRVVTLVSDAAMACRDHYSGIDNIAAGRTAARLLGQFLADQSGEIALIAGSMRVKDHVERRLGFDQVLHADYPHLRCLPVLEAHDDPDQVAANLSPMLADRPAIVGLYSLGAGTRGLISVLRQTKPRRKLTAVAHELTPHARTALLDGTLDAVINQDAGFEVASAIRVIRQLVDGEEINSAQERPKIEIYLKDNLP